MNRTRFSPLVGSVLGFFGYLVGAFLLMSSGSSESAGAFFFFALVGIVPATVAGALAGKAFGKRRLFAGSIAGLLAGFAFPFVAFYLFVMVTGIQDQIRRRSYDAKSDLAFREAKNGGFIFPTDVVTGLVGQVWSKETLTDVRDFYNRELSADWDRRDLGTTAWYVRKSRIAGPYDQIQLRKEYGRTSIYFRTTDHQQLKVQVAGAFAVAVENSDWKTALSLCGSELAIQGATKIKVSFKGLKPSSSAFVRKYMPPGNSAPLGVNAKLELGENSFRSGEIGLEMSDDTIPLVKRIEIYLP